MKNRDLLKEAIADAKAVKETAIANAKLALEESFAPYLKEKLSAKLAEMDEEEEEAKVSENARTDAEEEGYKDGMKDEKEDMEEMSNPVMRRGLKGDDSTEYETEMMRDKEGMDEEMDLDELLAELDKELNEDARTDAEEEGYLDGMKDEKEDEEDKEEDEDIDLEEMSEDDLKAFVEDVIADMIKAGTLEGDVDADETDEESDDEVEIEVEDETSLAMEGKKEKMEEIYDIGAMNISDAQAIMAVIAGAVGVPLAAIISAYAEDKIRGVKDLIKGKKAGAMKEGEDMKDEEVDEMKKEIEELKSELNEINLLNSKLLYVNKIFRSKNLTENQKAKVLGAFDKAATVAEVKLVFETLSEGLTTAKAAIKENLGRASKPMGTAPKAPILEVNNQFERWQRLAGIK